MEDAMTDITQQVINKFNKDIEDGKYKHDQEINGKLWSGYRNNLKPIVHEKIDGLYSKPKTKDQLKRNLMPLNVIPKIVQKTAQVYANGVVREAADASIQDLVDDYVEESEVNETLSLSDKVSKLQQSCLIQHFFDAGYVRHRVIPAQHFFVISTDPIYPNVPNIIILWVGTEDKIHLYRAYSDTQIVGFDSEGRIRPELVNDIQENPWGILPFTYVNYDETAIAPNPDEDLLDASTFLPIQFANLNYVAEFQTHAMTIIYDAEPNNDGFDAAPDSVYVFNSNPDSGAQPRMESVSPSTNINDSKQLIIDQFNSFLKLRGVRANIVGISTDESGVAKMIEGADTSEIVKESQNKYVSVEADFWYRLMTIHDYESNNNNTENKARFGDATMSITFPQPESAGDTSTSAVLVSEYEAGLISQRFALKQRYPNLSDDQIQSIIDETNAEACNGGTETSIQD